MSMPAISTEKTPQQLRSDRAMRVLVIGLIATALITVVQLFWIINNQTFLSLNIETKAYTIIGLVAGAFFWFIVSFMVSSIVAKRTMSMFLFGVIGGILLAMALPVMIGHAAITYMLLSNQFG